jgi:hypothetical protein
VVRSVRWWRGRAGTERACRPIDAQLARRFGALDDQFRCKEVAFRFRHGVCSVEPWRWCTDGGDLVRPTGVGGHCVSLKAAGHSRDTPDQTPTLRNRRNALRSILNQGNLRCLSALRRCPNSSTGTAVARAQGSVHLSLGMAVQGSGVGSVRRRGSVAESLGAVMVSSEAP